MGISHGGTRRSKATLDVAWGEGCVVSGVWGCGGECKGAQVRRWCDHDDGYDDRCGATTSAGRSSGRLQRERLPLQPVRVEHLRPAPRRAPHCVRISGTRAGGKTTAITTTAAAEPTSFYNVIHNWIWTVFIL